MVRPFGKLMAGLAHHDKSFAELHKAANFVITFQVTRARVSLSGIHVFIIPGFPPEKCGNDKKVRFAKLS